LGELVERGLEVLSDFGGDHVGIRQVGRVLQAFVFQPEDVEVDLVALKKVFVGERLEAFGLFACVAVLWVVALDKIV